MATADSGNGTAPVYSNSTPERYNDGICRQFAVATLLWGVVATALGVFVGLMMVMPTWITGYEDITVGRMRPLHTTLALFAFVGNGIFAAVYYTTQRLCRVRLWSNALGQIHFWGWQVAITWGTVALFEGASQAREYAEMQWPIDVAIAIAWAIFGLNFFMTLARRREPRLYISLWFYIASIVVFGIAHTLGNVVIPMGLWASIPVFAGIQDSLLQWWHGNHLILFFLTMPFLGLMYYIVPKVAGRPLYSYPLAIIHFWSLLVLAIWAWPRALHFTPAPETLSSLGMLAGMMLVVPSLAAAINGLKTLRTGSVTSSDAPDKNDGAVSAVRWFLFVALICYSGMSLIDAITSIKSVGGQVQFTDFTIAQMHLGTLGWNGMMMFALFYWLAPRLFEVKLYSVGLVKLHFGIATAGILLYVVPLYLAGIMESRAWLALDESGQLAHPEFLDSLLAALPMWWIRIVGGTLYCIGIVLIGGNYVLTWLARPSQYAANIIPTQTSETPQRTLKTGSLVDVPVLELAKSLEKASDLSWHMDWEKSATRFGWTVAGILLISTAIQFGPAILLSKPPSDFTAELTGTYTPLEWAGRQIYVAEGCQNCHSQVVRPMIAETMRYGILATQKTPSVIVPHNGAPVASVLISHAKAERTRVFGIGTTCETLDRRTPNPSCPRLLN